VVEGTHRLLHGRVSVRSMCVYQVHILEAKTLERGIHTFKDMLSREPDVIDWVISEITTPVNLGPPVSNDSAQQASGNKGTFVEMTKSLRFQPNFLMAWPITFSDSPPEYPSAQSKKFIPISYAAFMQEKVFSVIGQRDLLPDRSQGFEIKMLPFST
jgi:hypothetical protein